MRKPLLLRIAFLGLLALLATPALIQAQPFNIWMNLEGNGGAPPANHGYAEIANAAVLNPTAAITLEGWVFLEVPFGGSSACRSLIGKGFVSSYWVGVCGSTLRSYLRGSSSLKDGGTIPPGEWNHFAVTFDGAHRSHYINGELVATFTETAPLPTNSNPLRIGSDVDYDFSPFGSLNEFRLWNIALSQTEIRSLINTAITTPQPGLVAVWRDGLHDALGTFTGTAHGAVTFNDFAVTANCGATNSDFLCLLDHISVSSAFRNGPPGTAESPAHVAVFSATSGIFWFFAADNWEVTVKAVDGCGVNNHNWTFITSDTSLFYRTTVFDTSAGVQKIYFNYATLTPFSILDTSSMPCP